MLINLKVKTLDARTHEFSIDNEITIRQFKDQIAEKTNISAENQRIIYQGRVLADDKQVKEYDVDGKVLHVAERPPFSQRGANATNNDEPMRFRNMMGGRPTPRNLRNSPYFRALDGMLVGTMAIPVNNGPLAAPGTRTPPNRFPNSSSFCINRITVALHMIDCANNIAAYLENPEVGLNNQSLDILQRGRWTMESTVVEVGVSSTDMPRNNNIIDMVQDAVTAALSRNTPGRNYTVVQLPTVYTNEGGDGAQQRAGGNEGNNSEAGAAEGGATGGGVGGGSDTSEETTAAAAVIIEDVIETDDEAADAGVTGQGEDERSSSPQEAAGAVGGAAAGGAEDNASNVAVTGIGPRRRTRPQVLANVIQRYRTVQTRLAPFVDRYYEILEQDPTFEEHDNAGRENAQRIFDRVSEAFHYLSHAQHAISDLMLDLSQPGPRVLTCRPILVEQSGYIRSNNIFTPNLVASPLTELIAQAPPMARAAGAGTGTGTAASAAQAQAQTTQSQQQVPVEQSQNPLSMQQRIDNDLRSVFGAEGAEEIAAGAAEAAAAAAVVAGLVSTSERVEDPVDEPMVAPPTSAGADQQHQQQPHPELDEERSVAGDEAPTPRLRLYMPVRLPPPNHPQVQMARLIQAVVNSATNDADLHVEFNAPNIMSINLPVHVMTAAVHPAQARPATGNTENVGGAGAVGEQTGAATAGAGAAGAAAAAAAGGAAAGVGTASTSSGTRSGEQRANTLPTTATQTRSTSRPQIQIGGNNNWAGRIAPTHTAFDRFLPCNSHHIREPEPLPQNNNNGSSSNSSSSNGTNNVNSNNQANGSSNSTRIAASNATALGGADLAAAAVVGGSNATAAATATPSSAVATAAAALLTGAATRGVVGGIPIVATATGAGVNASATAARESSNLRTQLRSFLHQNVFEGSPINEETTPTAISRALNWFGDSLVYLPQYERPEYNSRDSVCNTLRQSLLRIIELCNSPASGTGADQFEQRLKQICDQFRKRLYSVLFLCLGSANAELFWRQLMRLLCVPLRSNFRNEALQFLCIYIDPTIPVLMDTADAQQFLVLRNVQSAMPKDNDQQQQQQQQQTSSEQLDNDVEMDVDVASSSSSSATDLEPPLPDVVVGSEPWHNNFPNDWLPVITRDLQTQTEQTRTQPPYSDAYISGMSAKRRKIIQTEKPSQNVECLIASGVQRAIQSAGLATSNAPGGQPLVNPDVVIGAIAHDAAVQASYTEAVRNNARERLKQDIDYKPSKYPQIAKFTEQQK